MLGFTWYLWLICIVTRLKKKVFILRNGFDLNLGLGAWHKKLLIEENIMYNQKNFFKRVPVAIWIILAICLIVICALPIVLTRPGFINFTETGQIGDTIGGTMGPFIAIVAALLTFIAFWVQFEANQELIKENRRNHFENRFYKMLDIHLDNVELLNNRREDKKQDSIFHVWCMEIMNLFNVLRMQSDLGGFVNYIRQKYGEEPTQAGFIDFLRQMQESNELFYRVIFEITYSYFFNKEFSSLRFENPQRTGYVREFASLFTSYLATQGLPGLEGSVKNELLGRYYRHLFQIVKYVDDQPDELYEEINWKSSYIGILRSQMSDFEQLLLYYNAQSSFGKAWDENHYIEKYRLIKNIPGDAIAFSAGIVPSHRYQEEIKKVEAAGEKFFERG